LPKQSFLNDRSSSIPSPRNSNKSVVSPRYKKQSIGIRRPGRSLTNGNFANVA